MDSAQLGEDRVRGERLSVGRTSGTREQERTKEQGRVIVGTSWRAEGASQGDAQSGLGHSANGV